LGDVYEDTSDDIDLYNIKIKSKVAEKEEKGWVPNVEEIDSYRS